MPNPINLVRLACYFDTSVDYLLGKTDEIEPEIISKSYKYLIWCDIPDICYIDTSIFGRHNKLFMYSCNDINKPIVICSDKKIRAKLFLRI